MKIVPKNFSFKLMRKLVLRWFIIIALAAGVFCALILTSAYFLGLNDVISDRVYRLMAATIVSCTVFGIVLSIPISMLVLNPIKDIASAMDELASGNLDVKVDLKNGPEELKELYSSFNRMAEELSQNEIFRRDFINNFSHEFKTPIVSIRGFAKQLEKDPEMPEEKKKEYIAIIAAESDRLANMATNVLLLSKLENQQYITREDEIELDEQLRQCILLLERQWTAKSLELDIALDPIKYVCDGEMLHQLWMNLLSNAIKFTPSGKTIHISAEKLSDHVRVVIRDEGIGMDEKTLERAFDRFYQADPSRATRGNGLGLTLVSRIVKLCDAKMNVKSSLGEGTEFEILLPIESSAYAST